MVGIRSTAPALAYLGVDRAGDHVTWGQVLDGRRVTLHEALAVPIAQDAAFTPGRLGQQDAELVQGRSGGTGRTPCPPAAARAGRRSPSRRRSTVCALDVVLKTLPKPPVARMTDLALKTCSSPVASSYATTPETAPRVGAVIGREQQVQHVELVEELDLVLQRTAGRASAGSCGRCGRQRNSCGAPAPGRARGCGRRSGRWSMRPSGVRLNGSPIFSKSRTASIASLHITIGSVLVDQVVTTLDGVERVPLPVVLLDVREGRRTCRPAPPLVWERVG